jgi:hypothetical protein
MTYVSLSSHKSITSTHSGPNMNGVIPELRSKEAVIPELRSKEAVIPELRSELWDPVSVKK